MIRYSCSRILFKLHSRLPLTALGCAGTAGDLAGFYFSAVLKVNELGCTLRNWNNIGCYCWRCWYLAKLKG